MKVTKNSFFAVLLFVPSCALIALRGEISRKLPELREGNECLHKIRVIRGLSLPAVGKIA
jgi:hypothetical protein